MDDVKNATTFSYENQRKELAESAPITYEVIFSFASNKTQLERNKVKTTENHAGCSERSWDAT